jgi:signal recognition particle subunit SRP54
VSTGEKPKDFEVFHPERMASRILGMGDVLSLVEKAEDAVAKDEAEELAAKLMRDEFDLNDFLAQLEQIRKMGGLNDMISMLPANMMPKQLRGAAVDESALSRTKAVIQSMTAEERKNPKIINGSRRARIAKGSGTTTAEVNGLIKQYEMMRKMVKSMKGGKRKNALPFMMG